jgi:hypothetical protein
MASEVNKEITGSVSGPAFEPVPSSPLVFNPMQYTAPPPPT